MTTTDRLLEEKNCWLCTVRPDGRPHLSPIWFVVHDGRFWIGTGQDAVKTRNIRANPKVSLSLQDGNDPLVVEGTAIVHTAPFAADVIAGFMAKFGWDVTRDPDEDIGTIVLIEVAIDRWLMGGPA